MSVSSVKRCLWGTNNPNMEETGSLENPIPSGKCYLDLNRAYNSSRLSSEVMTVLRSWSWLPSQETMQQMAKKATAVYVESVEDLRGSPPHVD